MRTPIYSTPYLFGRRLCRSGGLHSAGPQTSSLPGVGESVAPGTIQRPAECNSAIRPTASLRYDQCAEARFRFSSVARQSLLLPALFLAVMSCAATPASLFSSETKLMASDAVGRDAFGTSVAISGDTLVVGAPEADAPNGLNSGAAYIFVRDGTGWKQQAKLAAGDGAVGDFFGTSVGISGDTAVVGAYGDDGTDSFSGSAYVFVRSGTSWTQQAKLFGNPALNEQFGTASAVSGDTIVVGSAQGNWGYAYVFVRNGTTWTPQQTLPARGRSVAIEWDTIVVGGGTTIYEPLGGLGTAYVFVREATSWVQQAELTGNQDDYSTFGSAVSISGDTVVVGASGWSDNGAAKTGHAYTFVRSGGNWPLQQVLTASDAALGDGFGASVAVEGNLLIVGAPLDSAPTDRQGSAYVCVWDGARWVEQEKLRASDAANSQLFGYSVTTTRGTVAAGTRFTEAAYIYEPPSPFPPPPDTRPPKIAISAPANNATVSGAAVAISAEAEDNLGIAGVQFKLDETNLGAEVTAAPYSVHWDTTPIADGVHTLLAVARDAAGNQTTSSPVKVTVSNGTTMTVVWVEDTIPAGAWTGIGGGDSWSWVTGNPPPFSGQYAHQSELVSGIHYHYFTGASAALTLNPGDTLITYVLLDPNTPPQELMLQWFDGSSWAHAAYWGANLMSWSTDGTASQRPMGALPPAGQWVRLEVPTRLVDLGGRTVSGMNFILHDGRATWDDSGKLTANAPPTISDIADQTISQNGSTGQIAFTVGDLETSPSNLITTGTSSNPSVIPEGNILLGGSGANRTVQVMAGSQTGTVTITVTVTDGDGGKASDSFAVTVTERPTVTVTAPDGTASETGPDIGAFTIKRSGSTASPLTVRFTLTGGAANGTDYQALPNTVTIPASATSASLTVTPIDDSAVETSETVELTLNADPAYSIGSPSSDTVVILDNDQSALPTVQLAVDDGGAAEWKEGGRSDNGDFFLWRQGDTSTSLTVFYTVGGTASNGVDYKSIPDSATFQPGIDHIYTSIEALPDAEVEGTETIVLTLKPDPHYQIGSFNNGTVSILDNDFDTPPTVNVANLSGSHTTESSAAVFKFWRSGGTSAPLTVNFSMGGTATSGSDYEPPPSSVTFGFDVYETVLQVQAIDDAEFEGDETVVLTISPNENYTRGSMGSAMVTIVDNDPAPLPTVTVVASDPNASETGPDSGAFTISRSGNTASALTVQYTLGGTAGNGPDYQALPVSVTIPAGQASAVVTVAPIDDGDIEDQETVSLILISSSAYTIGSPNGATVSIADNDASVTVQVLDTEASENGPDSGTFQLSRNIAVGFGGPLTVYFTMDGDTVNGADYQQLGPSITFPAGVNRVTLDVTPIDDTLVEGPESVVLRLNPDPNYRVGIPDRGVIRIADKENTGPPVVWVEDNVPAGAWTGAGGGDSWPWVSSNPAPFSGARAHQSSLAAGIHYHYFTGASATLKVNPGDTLVTYIYLDPTNPPREIMLQWFDGASWGHGAYWGEDLIPWGAHGTASRRNISGLPPSGQWVRLEVPANLVDLEGRTLSGMNFLLYDGRATWDASGKTGAGSPPPADTTPPTIIITAPANNAVVSGSSITVSADASDDVGVVGVQFQLDGANLQTEDTSAPYSVVWDSTANVNGSHTITAVARDAAGNQTTAAPLTVTVNNSSSNPSVVWMDDSVPAGAWTGTYGGDQWSWVSSDPAPQSGSRAHQSANVPGIHYHYFTGATATLPVNAGDTLFAFVFLDPANPPQEVMLQWFDGSSWSHVAYWGANLMAWGVDGTESRRPMGALPSTGQWVKLEVSASLVGLEGRSLIGMNFVLYDGRATWDSAGK